MSGDLQPVTVFCCTKEAFKTGLKLQLQVLWTQCQVPMLTAAEIEKQFYLDDHHSPADSAWLPICWMKGYIILGETSTYQQALDSALLGNVLNVSAANLIIPHAKSKVPGGLLPEVRRTDRPDPDVCMEAVRLSAKAYGRN